MATGKQRGYRVRTTVWIPCDHSSPASVRAAMDYAEKYSKLLDGAPEGAEVEIFSSAPARRE